MTPYDEIDSLKYEIKRLNRSHAHTKGELTKIRNKSAKALELVELLEWAKTNECAIHIDIKGVIDVWGDSTGRWELIATGTKQDGGRLLCEARKMLEGE